MASEHCLAVCSVELVVGANYVWCLVIVAIFTWFGVGKRCHDTLKSSIEMSMQTKKGVRFMGIGGMAGFFVNLYCKSYCEIFYRIRLSLYYCCFYLSHKNIFITRRVHLTGVFFLK